MEIDTVEKLDIGFDTVKCVVHLSDVHIRLTKRHEEYREAFQKVYEGIKKTPPNTVIINTGDTFHSKVDLSPEAIQIASEFLKSLADLRPTILIAGNHDCLLTNSQRLDSLSPIVNNLAHKNLFYLKESKLYGAGNILINNMSVFDDSTKYLAMKDVVKSVKNKYNCTVALFHGPVHDAETEIGYKINNRTITTSLFDGHDIAMLGDIHLIQDLQKYSPADNKPIIRYAGSMIMQNHGENLEGHGYTVWNVDTRKHIHVEVPNDYCYYTIDVEDGKLITDISNIPAKPKLRVRCKGTVATEVKQIVTEIRKICDITDLVYVRVDSDSQQKKASSQSIANLTQISNVDYQNTLILDFLKEKYPEIDESTLDAIVDINKTLNDNLSKDDQSKNIRWKPKKFEFSNMFSYGENNVIDFTKLNDVYGVFASNASGKSSLMDALSFCIFDKSARAFKASQIINSEKMSFSCKFNFEINGVDYFIERSGARDKKGNVKVEVNFYKMEKDEKVPLNAEARRSTNEIIRDYVGTYDDFILTTLSLQGNGGSFIDMGQSERKELLSQFIGLNLFEKLALISSDRIKEISGAIKAFNKEDNTKKSADMANEIDMLQGKLADLTKSITTTKDSLSTTTNLINEESKKIVNLVSVPANVESLNSEKETLTKTIKQNEALSESIRSEIPDLKSMIQDRKDSVTGYNSENLDEKEAEANSILSMKDKADRGMEKLKTLVQEKIKKLEHLDKHQYDPNCSYCMDNIFVKDAISTRESLNADKESAKKLIESISEYKVRLAELEPFRQKKISRDQLVAELPVLENKLSTRELKLNSLVSSIEKSKARISEIESDIELYEKSKEIIEVNKSVRLTLESLNQELKNKTIVLKKMEDEYIKDYARMTSISDQIQTIKTRIEEIELFENEFSAFEYYSQAIGPNGIPYQIISDVIPQIEVEVNNILTQIVDFGMSIETDGKNVNVYINYEDKKWPLELCSGMEKFIASLALRVALINVSNLPRANFMVIDEGMSALDSTNMPMMAAFFSYMKTTFEFVIIISHLDVMRDMVGKQLEITKKDGFSYINI
jgi:DNA repair exonuclease SbcCD ATPase subunit